MKDSGIRETFETGAVREEASDKPRPDLIPACALLRAGEWYRRGAEKYSARNWEKGIPNYRHEEALTRHWLKYLDGQRDEDHLSAILFNVCAIMFNEEKLPQMCLKESEYSSPKADNNGDEHQLKKRMYSDMIGKEDYD